MGLFPLSSDWVNIVLLNKASPPDKGSDKRHESSSDVTI